mgnify:CR=1 FL=1
MKLLRLFPKELKDFMYKINKIILSLILLFILVFFSFNLKNFRIDASSDTLVSQNDKDFLYFNYYNEIFDSNNYLVLAIKSSKEIDKKLIIGSIFFGAGWGLAGLCPGPAISSIALLNVSSGIFVISMFIGFYIAYKTN